MQTRSSTIVLLHGIFWILLIQLIFDWSGLYYAFIDLVKGETLAFDEAFILLPFCLLLFYWNSNYLIPKFLNKRLWHYYLIGIVLSYFLVLFLEVVIAYVLENRYSWRDDYDIELIADNALFFNLLAVALSSAWGVSQIAFENAALNKEAKRKQEEAELKFLTAQVNPHFLYNTLNGIYAQALEEKAEKTTELILQLSEIMRYPLNTVSKKSILLKEEVAFIEKFITLQRLRLGESYPISFIKVGDYENIEIIPFLFIPLVENAFKYGISQKDKSPISFSLEIKDKELIFVSKNKIVTSSEAKSHLIGINNLASRLKLSYPNKYSFDITEKNKEYIAKLKLHF